MNTTKKLDKSSNLEKNAISCLALQVNDKFPI